MWTSFGSGTVRAELPKSKPPDLRVPHKLRVDDVQSGSPEGTEELKPVVPTTGYAGKKLHSPDGATEQLRCHVLSAASPGLCR